MGGQIGQDLAQVGLGFLDAGAQSAINNLQSRQANERDSLTRLANNLAAQGQLNSLPPDVMKSFEKSLGPNITRALQFQSNLRQQQLAPIQELRSGLQNLINAPVQEQAAPTQSFQQSIAQAPQQAPTELAGLVQQQQLPQDVSTQQPAVVEERAPTAAEKFQRFDRQVSPLGVALLSGDVQLGQLQVSGQNIRNERVALELRKQKQALDQQAFKSGGLTDVIDEQGRQVKSLVLYRPDGTVSNVVVGEGPQKGKINSLIQQLEVTETALADPKLTDSQRGTLERRRARLAKSFENAQKKGGTVVNVDGRPQLVSFDPKTGEIRDIVNPGDDTQTRQLRRRLVEARIGTAKETATDREIRSSGRLALKTLDRLEGIATPGTVGLVGRINQITEGTLATLESAPLIIEGLNSFVEEGRFIISDKIENKFRKKLLSKFAGKTDAVQAALDTLAAIDAKFTDPDSAIREEEFNRIRRGLNSLSFPQFVAKVNEIRAKVNDRITESQTRLDNVIGQSAQMLQEGVLGADPQRADVSQQAAPSAVQPATNPTRELVVSEAQNLGIDLSGIDAQQRHDLAVGVNKFIQGNPNASEAAIRGAVRLLLGGQ